VYASDAVCASTVPNADCDCSAGDDRGVANDVGVDVVNVRLKKICLYNLVEVREMHGGDSESYTR